MLCGGGDANIHRNNMQIYLYDISQKKRKTGPTVDSVLCGGNADIIEVDWTYSVVWWW